MIDRTKRHWTGNSPDDILQYIREQTDLPLEGDRVYCEVCGGGSFAIQPMDAQLGLRCLDCGRVCAMIDRRPVKGGVKGLVCPVCKEGRRYDLSIARHEGRAFLGSRCQKCGALSVELEWQED